LTAAILPDPAAMDPFAHLTPGRPVTVYLVGNRVHRGQVDGVGNGWLMLKGVPARLINLAQVVEIMVEDVPAEAEAPDALLPKPRSKDGPVKAGSRAPGRPWADEDLQGLAHAFLDGGNDSALAERFGRTRGQITLLRQGFECARGNIADDAIPPVAQTWVARWRKVLAG
jgi:hypothetical protein